MKINKILLKDDKENILIVLFVAIIFYINEFIKFKVTMPYLGYLLRNHFNDFLGGVSFMALINFILFFSKYNKIKKLIIMIFIGLLCSIYWEVITPIYKLDSVGDPWDVVAYCIGFLVYWIIKRVKNKDATYVVL